jgi:hypothetical protein
MTAGERRFLADSVDLFPWPDNDNGRAERQVGN